MAQHGIEIKQKTCKVLRPLSTSLRALYTSACCLTTTGQTLSQNMNECVHTISSPSCPASPNQSTTGSSSSSIKWDGPPGEKRINHSLMRVGTVSSRRLAGVHPLPCVKGAETIHRTNSLPFPTSRTPHTQTHHSFLSSLRLPQLTICSPGSFFFFLQSYQL